MESLHILITVYMSDVYQTYRYKVFKRLPTGYSVGIATLQDTIYDHYGVQVPLVTLIQWCHEGITIPYKQISLLDDATLMELVGFIHTLPISDALRKSMVTVYIHRLINDHDIKQALTYGTLTTQQRQYYERLEQQITGTRYDAAYVDNFKRAFGSDA